MLPCKKRLLVLERSGVDLQLVDKLFATDNYKMSEELQTDCSSDTLPHLNFLIPSWSKILLRMTKMDIVFDLCIDKVVPL